MGFYDDQVVPRLTDVALGRPMEETRAQVTAGLAGEVLEIGFGSGRNLPHLPAAVTRLLVVEPAAVGRTLAAPRIAAAPFPVEFVGDDGQALPVADASVDHVLSTWTLCTIPDAEQALREIYRVLRPGGTMHFTEHGRSPRPRVARWQDRLTPAWGRIAGGCHLNRRIDDLVQKSGLILKSVQTYPMEGTALLGFAYEGIASKPD
ncbi:class I SAM-dependent methyltransferase [Frankia sp. AgB1.9]|uniref:class I SAM-dependent methyltransferase n=1 Tax=unclassified Frankia TaxID=2632575 RepID=UPI001932FF38|nr:MULTISPECIES: class I SAM-dependent methyltransferase [unclassified Frankia]MBL7487272.1 class I SAM-dependent methyltransferase [Frankia sp. AgW1.1]MBL7546279.1 class I SAM-dependent methyltransferase [Frankia sp. AgB1.9]MBL7618676.1 class I SAM-dependent methyltransferase [Frankia sp. AgB1.8]